jgi:hypothetical protein
MNDFESFDPEQDPRFPGGPWTGFFLQYWLPGRHTTNLRLSWHDGDMEGTGADIIGPYSITGRYDVTNGRCEWTKKYVGRHSVEYRGVNDGHGIWGVWELRQLGGLFTDRGGFHLWPMGTDVSEESKRTEQAVQEMMRAEFGRPLFRLVRWLILFIAAAGVALLLKWRWQI